MKAYDPPTLLNAWRNMTALRMWPPISEIGDQNRPRLLATQSEPAFEPPRNWKGPLTGMNSEIRSLHGSVSAGLWAKAPTPTSVRYRGWNKIQTDRPVLLLEIERQVLVLLASEQCNVGHTINQVADRLTMMLGGMSIFRALGGHKHNQLAYTQILIKVHTYSTEMKSTD